ncbi:hypothetical protein ACFLRN_02260 [Thermoproteota archaeon]
MTKQMSNLFVKQLLRAWFMGEENVNIQELAQKVEELLNVLNVISGDLAKVTKTLKTVSESETPPAISVAPSEKKNKIKDVKQAFSSELTGMLLFEETGKFVIVKPRRFLGSDNFAKIAAVVRDLGGEYISAGRNSHFKIVKK